MMKVAKVLVTIGILDSYLDILGLEESQSLKYLSLMTLSYLPSDIPRLLPVHQFVSVETLAVKNRIRCLLYKDVEQCLAIEMTRCEVKGKTTEAYEQCMIDLKLEDSFCRNHYLDESIWKDNLSPSYLQYYLRLHNCLGLEGQSKGREYCTDYYEHEDSWGKKDLY
jgi:hypothetical protein